MSALHILGDYRIDEDARRLFRGDGSEAELPGRAFDVLLVLLRHRGRVVGRNELLDAVWYDSDVSDAALSQALWLVRRALGAEGHRLIRTVPGRGYCIDALPEAAHQADGQAEQQADPAAGAVPDAVLPLAARPDAAPAPQVTDVEASTAPQAPAPPAAPAVEPARSVRPTALRGRWRRAAPVLGLAAAALAALVWMTVPRHGAIAEPAASEAETASAPALRIVLRLAPGAPAENAWLLGALRGVLRTGLHGNPDLQVESALDTGVFADGPRLSGTVALDRVDSVPRQVRIDWRLTGFDGRTRRWRDSAPADRLFDIADRVQARLRDADPSLASIGAGTVSGPVPIDAQRRFARGAEAKSAQRHAEAAAEFEAALQAFPGFLLARTELADALIEQGYRAAAAAHLREVERALADAADTDAMALRARTLSLARDYAAAADGYGALVAAHPDVLPWRLAGAQAYALSGRGAQALALLAPIASDGLSPRMRVFHHKVVSLAAMAAGDADRALVSARRAVDAAVRLGEPELQAEAYQNLIALHYRRGEIAEALRLSDLAVAAGDRGRSLLWRYEVRQFRVALRVLDDRPVQQAELDALASVARSTGDLYREGAVALIFANERYRRLDLEGAIEHRRRALALLERSGDAHGIDTVLQSLFALERLRGEREAALGALEQLEARRVGNTLDPWQLEFESARGEIWTGRLAAASARLRRALRSDDAEAQPIIGRAHLSCLLGQAQTLAGDASAALTSLQACDDALASPDLRGAATGPAIAREGIEHAVLRARAAAWRAMAAGRLGRDDEVARHLREAENRLRPTRDYRTLEALGELALAAGLVGDPAQAGPILAWIAERSEATAAALPRAMLRRGQCALSRRGGLGGAVTQCVEAEAAAMRIEHPMLRMGPAPPGS